MLAPGSDFQVPTPTLSISPLEIARLPLLHFSGRIVVISVAEDEQRVEALFAGETLLGFDTESRANTPRSPRNRIALVQIATESACCVWRISEMGRIPPLLRRLIEDPSLHKVVQGATQEVDALRDQWGLSPQSFIDLHKIALELRTTPRSLQGLVGLFLKKKLAKDQRFTDWEQAPLTKAQIEYAALDAWASRQVLVSMRETYLTERLLCEKLIGTRGPPRVGNISDSSFVAGADTPSGGVARLNGGSMAMPAPEPDQERSPSGGTTVPTDPLASSQYAQTADAHRSLAALCIERGYILRFDGFESAPGGYRCVFCVEYRHKGHNVAEAFRSKRTHVTIRGAQNDAAAQALLRLQPIGKIGAMHLERGRELALGSASEGTATSTE